MARFRKIFRLETSVLALCLLLTGTEAWAWILPRNVYVDSPSSNVWRADGDMVRRYHHMVQTYNLYNGKKELIHYRKIAIWAADDEFKTYCIEVFMPNVDPAVLPTECSATCTADQVYTKVEKTFRKLEK